MKVNIKRIILSLLVIKIILSDEEKPINIKVVPSRSNKLTIQDLDSLKMEILHDMNDQIRNMEDQMADYERLKEKTSSNWSKSGAPIFIPKNPTNFYLKEKNESNKEENKEQNSKEELQIAKLFNKINSPSVLQLNNMNLIVEDKLRKLTQKLEESNQAIKKLNQEKYEKQRFKQISNNDSSTYSDIEIINKLEEQNNELSSLNNKIENLSNLINTPIGNQSFLQKTDSNTTTDDILLNQSIIKNTEELKKMLI